MLLIVILLSLLKILISASEFQDEDLPYVGINIVAIDMVSKEMGIDSLNMNYPVALHASHVLATCILLRRYFPNNPEYVYESVESYPIAQRFGYSLKIYLILQKLLDYSVFLTGLYIWPDEMFDKFTQNSVSLTPRYVKKVEEIILAGSPLLKISRRIKDDASNMKKELNRMRNIVSTFVLHYLLFSEKTDFCPEIMDEILKLNLTVAANPFPADKAVEDVQTIFETFRGIAQPLRPCYHHVYQYLREIIASERPSVIQVDPKIIQLANRLKTLLK